MTGKMGMERVFNRISQIQERFYPVPPLKREMEKKEQFVHVLQEAERGQELFGSTAFKKRPHVEDPQSAAEKAIRKYGRAYSVNEDLIRAVIKMESGGNKDALSPKGAMGLMQLMPGTAQMLGVSDPFDPEENIRGGVKYLALLADKYNGDVEKVLAAYNAGPARVDSFGGIPPFSETQRYVRNVLAEYRRNMGSD
ncbi:MULTISPECIES: lytic transglycosylase domain-containing protein [Aminobacterium]|nr:MULTISPECIES: lytic transglycosylase domain-containing protein [unclassified Aminobacterium]